MSEPSKPSPPPAKPARTLSYGVANPKTGSGGKYRPAPAKPSDD